MYGNTATVHFDNYCSVLAFLRENHSRPDNKRIKYIEVIEDDNYYIVNCTCNVEQFKDLLDLFGFEYWNKEVA